MAGDDNKNKRPEEPKPARIADIGEGEVKLTGAGGASTPSLIQGTLDEFRKWQAEQLSILEQQRQSGGQVGAPTLLSPALEKAAQDDFARELLGHPSWRESRHRRHAVTHAIDFLNANGAEVGKAQRRTVQRRIVDAVLKRRWFVFGQFCPKILRLTPKTLNSPLFGQFWPRDKLRSITAGNRAMAVSAPVAELLELLSPLELLRIIEMDEAEHLSSLSKDTLERKHSEKIIKLSPRRNGMRVADALMLRGQV
jgi:hypothetical protein